MADESEALAKIRARNPSLYRKLLKIARQSRGLVPVRTDAGETKRALRYVAAAVDGHQVSGKRARKVAKRMKRLTQDTV